MLLGEALVLGAGLGLVSAALMTLFEAPFWRKFGVGGVVEWQVNQVMVSWIVRQRYDPTARLGEAVAMHLFHGSVIGAVFMVFASVSAPSPWYAYFFIAGALSFVLWMVVPLLLRSYFERTIGTPFSQLGFLISLGSHLVYGFSLGTGAALILLG